MKKNYNYQRKKLQLPEYGRHIHEMVDFLATIDDREKRNRQARAVISVMGNLNPLLRDTADYNHKLWDHLFIMSDFTLDVDSPYPIPTAATLAPVPTKMKYPDKKIAIKHYGKNVEKIIKSLKNVGDQQAVEAVVGNIARYMRTKSYEYNQEHPNNEVIIRDIKRLSNNTLTINEVALGNIKSDYKQATTHQNPKKSSHAGQQRPGKGKPKNNQQGNKNGAQKQHRSHPKP